MIGKEFSHYRILEVLGAGGMGTIYRAEDTTLKRDVALKFLEPRPEDNGREKDRLVREARAASRLDHPNICMIFEVGEVDGRTYLAMACVEGQDLGRRVRADGRLPLDEALEIAIQVGRGLSEAHRQGIVHRDIKPENILLTPRGQVKITDFGLAGHFEPEWETDRDTTSGTVAYMSPEQIRGEGADRRSDIWSLGVVLYEMLTGRKPFEGAYDQAIVYSVLNVEPDAATQIREDLPDEVDGILSRALRKNPDERYQDIAEMLRDLEALVGSPGIRGDDRRPVAVVSFENVTGEAKYDYLSRAIPSLLITSLERSEHLAVMTWERMRDLAKQLGSEDPEVIDCELGVRLCGLAGVDTIIVGSFMKAGKTFATDAKVLAAKTKELLFSASARGEGVASILASQVDELSRGIVGGLGVPDDAAEVVERPVAEVTTSSMDAYEAFLKGRDNYEKLYNTDARRYLEEAVELDPEFAEAYLYLAWTYTRLRQAAARDDALERAMNLAARATRRERLYIEAAYARTVEHDRPKELKVLKQLAREYPGEKFVHHRLAGHYRTTGRSYQAIEEYNKVLALDPEFGWAMNELGYMYADIGDFDKAAEYFERYAASSPGDANPIDSLGELHFRMGRLDEATEHYRHALRLRPDFYYAYWELAYVSAVRERYEASEEWICEFIRHTPSFATTVEGHRWRAFYRFWLGQFDEAEAEARKIAELATEEGDILWQTQADRIRAWVELERGATDAARKHFESCLDAVRESPREFVPAATSYSPGTIEQVRAVEARFAFCLGLVELAEEQPGAARKHLTEIGGLLPELAAVLRSEILLAEGRTAEAIAVAEATPGTPVPYMSDTEGMLGYNLPPLRDSLARAYAGHGEPYKAIAEYERLLTVDPSTRARRLIHPRYHERLGELYAEKGWAEKADSERKLFRELWRGRSGGSVSG